MKTKTNEQPMDYDTQLPYPAETQIVKPTLQDHCTYGIGITVHCKNFCRLFVALGSMKIKIRNK